MTSAEIRQSFLDFFKSKGHTIVPSASLMPDSPNLLFTNAGMNQFVPIFLGQRAPDVSKWAGAVPGSDTRAADTQKCIRAGGKHNDLEDVGLDTYHHTFFEMLGNWSFGDYFKKEAITWAWELITEVWKFPKNRLYATVYSPDASKGDPSEFDQEAYDIWAERFRCANLDPRIHIVHGSKKDNFWMMGETGPCGPCSEIHVDLTPQGDTKGRLVNQGSAECIEIWNLVFIQFNANPDGTFSPLPAKHVDTGMGFERLTSFIQCTRNFTDFSRIISNYETDIFRPLFDRIEKLSGKKYGSTLPDSSLSTLNAQQSTDIAFRVLADHIRTLSFAIADGIQPGNTDRNYVLRRILRRAVRYGRSLGFQEPFFYKLVDVLAETMGHVFREIRIKQERVEELIQREEEAFNKTLDTGIDIFERIVDVEMCLDKLADGGVARLKDAADEKSRGVVIAARVQETAVAINSSVAKLGSGLWDRVATPARKAIEAWAHRIVVANVEFGDGFNPGIIPPQTKENVAQLITELSELLKAFRSESGTISGSAAFLLYDEKGFPLDLTELMARERGLTVDVAGFEKLMDEQKARARKTQKREIIGVASIVGATSSGTSDLTALPATKFVGYEKLEAAAKVLEVVERKHKTAVILDTSPFYAEMGGQVGDTGELAAGGQPWRIINTQKAGDAWLHFLSDAADSEACVNGKSEILNPPVGSEATLTVDRPRRYAIERHHTVTHLLHWALHEVVSVDATQKGSYVGPDKLTFDFSSAPLTRQQVADVERLVNERSLENEPVTWVEVKYSHIKDRKDIMQFFGEKYGEWVRVVQVGGHPTALDGYSMELCGGTHVRATGEIGLFRISAESAIAAGVRRIEAVSGLESYKLANQQLHLIRAVAGKVNSPVGELEKKIESLLAQQHELEKRVRSMQQQQATEIASGLTAKAQNLGSTRAIVQNLGTGDGDYLQTIADSLKGQFKGVVVLASTANGAVALLATVSPELTSKIQAGKIIQAVAPIIGGKGGGRPDNARGGGKDVSKLEEALARARELLKGT